MQVLFFNKVDFTAFISSYQKLCGIVAAVLVQNTN